MAGEALSHEERAIFRRYPPAGILLFARNVVSEPQLRALVAEIRAEAPEALLAVDQEGGPVDRFRAIAGASPSFAGASAAGAADLAGILAGEMCAAFAIDWDLAPVVDRAVEGAGRSVLRGRAPGESGEDAADSGRAFLEGLAASGVAGCLKHFPGLGRAAVDSHVVLPTIGGDRRALDEDLVPFRTLSRLAPAVMISHAAVGASALPATLDPAIATDLLRGEVGVGGLSISDDLEMGALAGFGSLPERAASAFAAGCDFLCIGKDTAALPDAAAAVAGRSRPERLHEAGRRAAAFRGEVARLRRERRLVPRAVPEIAAAFRRAAELLG
ncbi:MAG TPA: glycoside hydrolase family 3 N-terminal domain-containing protein [Thermoanaerobaculia bacterium]|nr:glycoside hydrolase family 3 N-terminal domain-containing protein [Thermoanaerobaculia bacterium]